MWSGLTIGSLINAHLIYTIKKALLDFIMPYKTTWQNLTRSKPDTDSRSALTMGRGDRCPCSSWCRRTCSWDGGTCRLCAGRPPCHWRLSPARAGRHGRSWGGTTPRAEIDGSVGQWAPEVQVVHPSVAWQPHRSNNKSQTFTGHWTGHFTLWPITFGLQLG